MSSSWRRAFAPATVSNLSCGFDLLGFALDGWGDVVAARATPEPGVRLVEIRGDDGRLPLAAEANTAGVAAQKLLELAPPPGDRGPAGVELVLEKGLPLASGLGSSGASAVAAALAVNAALGLDAGEGILLAAALAAEKVACGAAHPDNVAPALLGGLLLIRPGDPPAITRLPVPGDLFAAVLHPHAEVSTADARAVLPRNVPLATLTHQAGNLAALVAGLHQDDDDLIRSALVDHVAEPVRATLTPAFDAIRGAALEAGALGAGLSGSGPSVFALCRGEERAVATGAAMRQALAAGAGVDGDGDLLVSPVGAAGASLR